ncbi:SusD/RagB family nutrient-binding outer membrane lipoprotein [Rhabdobacter roseus]|uniref:SusD/RagB family nutrient-binding outer membrane lipoprotein n=1 Tax=Rhabdobacter roseus TaxID=1655419 RepID=A0A840TXI0_9BACT|nr:SusD/RagB family nutrient-binding outer membrane lipoprotein [Rhabdobacter roseus]MBB5284908.1 hypothetical protein [Rhabdobacter roseus]
MKFIKYRILFVVAAGLLVSSCDKQAFVDINKDPDALTTIPPQNQFLNASVSIHSQDFEAFYDLYQRIMPWMQYTTALNGNQGAFTQNWDNFSQRYGRLYNGVGDRLYDLEQLVGRLEANEQARYVHMIRIARILKAYYTFYVSDIYGSIPYSDAFQGRYGGTLEPTYDSQQQIFARLDEELKEAIATLKAAPTVPQVSLGTYDQYYGGNAQQWVKAGNALRLKIAMRQLKADAAKATAIINEVLAQPAADLMASNADSWIFVARTNFTGNDNGSNWNPSNLRAPKPIVDFMWANQDPRIDAFFTPNSYSQANINLLIANGQLPAGTQEPARRYVGSYTNPDDTRNNAIIQRFYTPRRVTNNGQEIQVDTLSFIQPRLFSAIFTDASGNVGTGRSYLPVITYADYCFMRAEVAARGIGTGSTKEWYEAGITSSINWYNDIAVGGQFTNYTPVTPAEITAYLAKPAVAFDASKALDQIASQAYLHFLKQPSEGWATWKRTGFPNPTSTVPMPTLTNLGATLVIPRRAPLGIPNPSSPNYANRQAAYDAMAQIAGFGRDPQDATGRVWWDRP